MLSWIGSAQCEGILTKPDHGTMELEGARISETAPSEGERYGDYEVIKPLASGGMADIFLARKLGVQGFQKLVVIKRIRRELVKDDHLIDMFIDEAHVAAKLDHPNVVVISDLGEVEDSYFMAMEYLRGQTLRTVQKKLEDGNKMLPPQFWARLMEFALDGLHYAHELRGDDGKVMGLVHRDFTPSNIMVTYTGTVKVIDFGVAHVEAPTRHETKIGTIKGKIAYMSPEQCRGTTVVDRRTDVFAAGIVLWELLSRRRLFDGPTDTAILVDILQGDIPLPGWPGQPIDQELTAIVMRSLERDLNRRYQSAAEMRDALRDYLRRQPQQVAASDIAEVMCQLFAEERAADDKLAQRDPSRLTPLPRRESSRSGASRSGSRSGARSSSQSGRRNVDTEGSARGQKMVDNATGPAQAQRSGPMKGVLIGVGVAAVILFGFGTWRYMASQQQQPATQPPQIAYAHPPELPKADPPKADPPPKVDPPPEVVAVKPPEKLPPPTPPKEHVPSAGYGFLDFDTRPYTSVYIGKKKVGDTPILGAKVPAGKVTLTLVNDDAGIHETYVVTVPKDGHVFKKLKL
jgi:eukaryotic-like serine/threonine-protein kinase